MMDYALRRRILRQTAPEGDILILSASSVPRNYPANTYAFHQDATFRYYTGLTLPDMALLIERSGKETLFVTPPDPDDIIWTGAVPSAESLAQDAKIANISNYDALPAHLNRQTLYIAPYDFRLRLRLAQWLGCSDADLSHGASAALGRAIIDQRMHKDDAEIEQIEEAITLTRRMIASARAEIQPGRLESDILSALLRPAIAHERQQAFEPIVTVHGEIMHTASYRHTIQENDMVLIDSGAESPLGYCADITRTLPASGRFTQKQQEIYDAVLCAQTAGIAQTAIPGTSQYDVHMAACRALTLTLQQIGLMKGNIDDSLREGAHALFMPHGIGHALGLDAHDMENFGDDVGYAPGTQRSTQFGLNYLRLHRTLEPGFVLTVEPGCYFIPALIDRWEAQKHCADFICYDALRHYRDARGIRIEDDVLITSCGSRVLGPCIEK